MVFHEQASQIALPLPGDGGNAAPCRRAGHFWAAMAVGNYQTVYLQSIGFPATDFGLLNAIACAVAIFAMTFWGTVSDRIGSVRKIVILTLNARLRPFHFCATHSDGAILLDAIISNLDPDHQLFSRTDDAVCR